MTARSGWNAPANDPRRSAGCAAIVGNTGVLVRAYTYIRAHGGSGLREVSEDAVLAANYLMHRVSDAYDVPYGDRPCKHEFVASAASLKKRTGVRTLDIAKRLIDYGFHPPTIYFPLIVEEAMLIEPTETESRGDAGRVCGRADRDRGRGRIRAGRRPRGAPHGARPAARRGHRGTPAEPALEGDDRAADAVPGLTAPAVGG